MTEQITKKDLEEVLDKKFGEYQGSVVEAVDFKLQGLEQRIDLRFLEIEKKMNIFDKKLD